MQKRHRIFIAINLPLEIKKALARYAEKFSDLPARWVPKDNLHITLAFLGNVTDSELGDICMAAKAVAVQHPVLNIALNSVGYGPDEKLSLVSARHPVLNTIPKMVWASGEKSVPLQKLKQDLGNTLQEKINNFKPENRGFAPHVTLARIDTMQWRMIDPEERPEVKQPIDLLFTIESIEVMEAESGKNEPQYVVIESMQLGG